MAKGYLYEGLGKVYGVEEAGDAGAHHRRPHLSLQTLPLQRPSG